MATPKGRWLLVFLLYCCYLPLIDAEGFTFPTHDNNIFIVGDVVNVTWNVFAARISLYQVCNGAVSLERNVTNKGYNLWTANRNDYRESGCVFLLQPLAPNGVPFPPNITSPLFGVNKRYKDDPIPTTYNTPTPTTNTTAAAAAATTSSSSSSTSPSSPSVPDTASSTAASDEPSTVHTSNGLSSAAKVGIGLGVPLGAIAFSLTGFALFFYRRRRQRQQLQEKTARHLDHGPTGVVEIGRSDTTGNKGHKHTLSDATTLTAISSTYVNELGNDRPASELMGNPRSELQ
ncbi:hypothetical protein VTN00DRAFT_3100 [Thermoascus crustaceus]|uniref:uncharacterized protein n=1 Tax=Thermoascus crustaceus TaxID=5088 RepID=UPI003743280E